MTQQPHALHIDPERCIGDMKCMRACPAQAIRVWNGTASMMEDRCIECGECITVCRTQAIRPLTDSFTDLSGFDYTVALPSPSFYSQFGPGVTPGMMHDALLRIGFDEVVDLTWACERTNQTLREYLAEFRGRKPIISSFCPAVVRLVQVRYPDLVDLISPLKTPKELMARRIKAERARDRGIEEERVGAVYLTPCPSKMCDVRGPDGERTSSLDGAVAISHLYGSMMPLLQENRGEPVPEPELSKVGLSWASVGGHAASLGWERILAVGGVENVVHILEQIENGRLREVDYVELRSCRDGCIGGCLMVENPYRARAKLMNVAKKSGAGPDEERAGEALPAGTEFLSSRRLSPKPVRPMGDDVATAIEKVKQKEELLASLPGIDCGACGSPTCSSFAEDVVAGRVETTDCIYKLHESMYRLTGELLDLLRHMPGNGGGSGRRET
jgi:Na+-translocating ferredoxin:NAD+ oxidoreductase RNF subunit RnfB